MTRAAARSRALLGALVVGAPGCVGPGCVGPGPAEPESNGSPPRAASSSVRTDDAPPPETIFGRPRGYIGVVVRERRVVVPAPFDARLVERFVRPGDPVAEGDPLARFDSEAVDRALSIARAAVWEAQAALEVAQVEGEQARARHDRRQGNRELFSAEQLEEAVVDLEVAGARVDAATARLAAARAAALEARARADAALLAAPLAGAVEAGFGAPGMVGARGAPVGGREAGEWHVRFAAPPEAAAEFRPGTPVVVLRDGVEAARGIVIHASPELDPRTLLLTHESLLCSEALPAGTPVRVLPAAGDPPPDCSPPSER